MARNPEGVSIKNPLRKWIAKIVREEIRKERQERSLNPPLYPSLEDIEAAQRIRVERLRQEMKKQK